MAVLPRDVFALLEKHAAAGLKASYQARHPLGPKELAPTLTLTLTLP